MSPPVIDNFMGCALHAAEKPSLVFYAYVCTVATMLLGWIPLVIYLVLRCAVCGLLLSTTIFSATLALAYLFALTREIHQSTQLLPLFADRTAELSRSPKENRP